MICERCNVATFIVDDPSNGCHVCTECGLVVSGIYTEDEAWFDKNTEHMSHEYTNPFQLAMQKSHNVSYKMFFCMQDTHQMKLVNFHKRFQEVSHSFQDLPESIFEDAKTLYLSIEGKTNMKGRNLDLIICALIFVSAKKNRMAINTCIFGREYEYEIIKNIQFVEDALHIKHDISNPEETTYYDKEIESYIVQYCTHFPEIKRRTRCDILKLIPKTECIMRKKNAIAAALIVYHLGDTSIIKALAQKFTLSDATIRAVLNDLKKYINEK